MATTLISINGTALPPPTEFAVKQADLDAENSGRSETGIMQRRRVRANVAKISAAWTNLTEGEVALIRGALTPDSFEVDYFFGATYHATMYAGDRDCTLKAIDADGSTAWDMTANLVEY